MFAQMSATILHVKYGIFLIKNCLSIVVVLVRATTELYKVLIGRVLSLNRDTPLRRTSIAKVKNSPRL
jgi:hypothetical protein